MVIKIPKGRDFRWEMTLLEGLEGACHLEVVLLVVLALLLEHIPQRKTPADKAPASLIMIFSAAARISGIMLFGTPKELRILPISGSPVTWNFLHKIVARSNPAWRLSPALLLES